MEEINLLQGLTTHFLIGLGLSFLAGFIIGLERESKGKPAGISTQCLVIGGSMIFSYLSDIVDPNSTSRIAAQIVTGIGFLGAGLILKSEEDKRVTNLTTAASIWFSCSINGIWIWVLYYGDYRVSFCGTSCAHSQDSEVRYWPC
jgi:putative Mg2+ transporter-C (MgtC) family protein